MEPGVIILIIIFALGGFTLLAVLFFSIYLSKKTPLERGKEGEETIAQLLDEIKSESAYVINDLTIDNGGIYSQIDHLYLCHGGIIVIETKNLSGRIYGRERSSNWTQILRNGKKYQLYSPILQNEGHMAAVRGVLKQHGIKNIELHSAIVFVKGNIDYIKSQHIYDLYTIKKFIRTVSKCTIYNDEELKEIYELLLPFKN